MSNNVQRPDRQPLADVQNLPRSTTSSTASGIKRNGNSLLGIDSSASTGRKTNIPRPYAQRRRETLASRKVQGSGDNVSQGNSQLESLRRNTNRTSRIQTSTSVGGEDSQASSSHPSRPGRINPKLKFTAAAESSQLKPAVAREATSQIVLEHDPETMRRMEINEAATKDLSQKVEKVVEKMQKDKEGEITSLRDKLSNMQEKLEATKEELNKKTFDLQNAQHEIQMKEMEFRTKQIEFDRSRSEQSKLYEDLEKKLRESEVNLKKARAKNAGNDLDLQSLKSEMQEKEIERRKAIDRVEELKNEVAKLKSCLSEEAEAKRKVEILLHQAEENNTKESSVLLSIRKEKKALEETTASMQEKQVELERVNSNLRKRLLDAEEYHEEQRKEVKKLRLENESLKNTTNQIIASHRDKLAERERSSQETCTELQESLTKLKCEVSEKSQDLDQARTQCRDLQSTVDNQATAMTLVQSEKEALRFQKETLEKNAISLSESLEEKNRLLEQQLATISKLEEQAREDEAHRRKLHNTVMELKGNIRVFCRVRPLLPKEKSTCDSTTEHDIFSFTDRNQGIVAHSPPDEKRSSAEAKRNFKFDHVFGPCASQDDVFVEISDLVQSALDGYRVAIFAYGQTGSGKTHTMLGDRGENRKNLGMIPRSLHQIFATAVKLSKDGWNFKFRASFLEIYNESIRDLLTKEKDSKEKPFGVKFDPQTKLCSVPGISVINVENEDHIQNLLAFSMGNRATASTQANERSSRSHSVFRLYIDAHNKSTGQRLDGLLNLIDLAGSERLASSKAEGARLKETQHINKSLSALSDVILSLSNKQKHTPFRNSKLTHLLQDSLGGDSKTLMFVNLSPTIPSFNESLCSLRFAAKVNACEIGTARKSSRIEI